MGREEFEQRNLDQVEENKLIAREHATQLHLLGIRNDRWGCPHYRIQIEGVGRCDANEMRACQLERDHTPCALFGEIIIEWEAEYENQPDALRDKIGAF